MIIINMRILFEKPRQNRLSGHLRVYCKKKSITYIIKVCFIYRKINNFLIFIVFLR
jgi:hypothetical protein